MKKNQKVRVTLTFSDEEWAAILEVMERTAVRYPSDFIRLATRRYLSRYRNR